MSNSKIKKTKSSLKRKSDHLQKHKIDIERIKKVKTLYQYDEVFTSKVHGFKSSDDYYEKCSSQKVLHQIKTPVLSINSFDDPFVDPNCLDHRGNPKIIFAVPEVGGHIGFLEGLNPFGSNWTLKVMEEYLDHFQNKN